MLPPALLVASEQPPTSQSARSAKVFHQAKMRKRVQGTELARSLGITPSQQVGKPPARCAQSLPRYACLPDTVENQALAHVLIDTLLPPSKVVRTVGKEFTTPQACGDHAACPPNLSLHTD